MNGHASTTSVVAVTITFTVLSLAFVAGRAYARLGVQKNPGLDDVAIVFAMVFAVGTTVAMLFQVRYGMGRRQASLSDEEARSMLQAFWVSVWMYNLSLSGTKISILLQYLRVFTRVKVFRICCWIFLGIVVVYTFHTFFTAIFACTPVAFFWDDTIEGGTCLPRFAIWFANTGINIGTDIAIAVFPIPVLSKLELPRNTKRALMTVFLLGGFTCIISILRLQSLYVVSQATDVSWHNPMAAIWSNLELNTAIMCSCLPTLRCIFPRIFKSKATQSRSWNSGEYRAGNGRLRLTVIKKSNLNRESSLTSEGSLENGGGGGGGGLDREISYPPRTEIHSGEDSGKKRESRFRGSVVEEADGGIMVSRAIEQEVESREDFFDDQSTKDLIMGHS